MVPRKHYIYDNNRRYSDQRQKSRKRMNNLILLSLLLGILSLLIAGGFLVAGVFTGKDALVTMARYYAGGGVVLLLLRVWLIFSMNRKKKDRRRGRSSNGDAGHSLDREVSPQSGGAFILVMVLLALLSAMLLQSQWMARSTHRLQEGYLLDARLRTSALTALQQGLAVLADDPQLEIDHLDEDWAENLEIDAEDGSSHVVRIVDLNRYFDLNNVVLESANRDLRPATAILMDLFTEAGHFTPVDRVESLQDWIDPDSEGLREAWFYEQGEVGYVPPNTWLQSWGEILWIDGLDREIWKPLERYGTRNRPFEGGLMDMVTLLPGARRSPHPVNINTASEYTLRGVMGPTLAGAEATILALRTGGPIQTLSLLAARIADPLVFESIRPYIALRSEYFAVEVRSALQGRSVASRALVRRGDDGAVQVLRWVS